MFIKVTSSRQEEWNSLDWKFNAKDFSEERIWAELDFFADKDDECLDPEISDEIMATVRLSIFEGPVCEKEDLDEMIYTAGDFSQDEEAALKGLSRCIHFPAFEWSSMSCTVYLERLYVEEKFRKEGVATWILDNLPEILRYFFRAEPQYVVTIPCPDGYLDMDQKDEMECAEIQKLQKLMVSVIRKHGFKKVRNKNIYYKDYATF